MLILSSKQRSLQPAHFYNLYSLYSYVKNFKPYKCEKKEVLNLMIINLYGGVNDVIAEIILKQCLFINSLNKHKSISLLINSPGGSVTSGLKIKDIMDYVDLSCNTVCLALAASMGAFLLASGSKNSRFGLNNSRIMIHQPLGGLFGDVSTVEIQANEILYYKLLLTGYLSDFCSKNFEEVLTDTDRDFFMSSAQAINYGVIDKILK